ncbi:hypothetical protein OEA41_008692 [Lepraria neglecta]|uniref:Uncharacterized protein n=1 Tax=Lepraria neglecta TaxID=209136 RepID=A0AAD9Z0I3_9LECA|nr:hypothetical protein OEA41_008692 [Lepraria neglecta]
MSSIRYQEPKTITKIPQELWNIIANSLPAFDARNAAQALGFELQPEQDKQSQLWNAIFRDNTWITEATIKFGLNPVLIGRDLHSIDTLKARVLYLILVAGDPTCDIQFELFLESLRPHKFHHDTMEVDFESGITLNVANVYQATTYPNPGNVSIMPQRLFSKMQDRLQTAYIYWQDSEPMLRMLGHDSMVGNGEEASKLQLVLNLCGLTLSRNGRPIQYDFDEKHQGGRLTALEQQLA